VPTASDQAERLGYIERAVSTMRFVSLREVAERFGVSIQTARRDVSLLADKGAVAKVHGGAVPSTEPDALSLDERLAMQNEEKVAIAALAASLVRSGDVVVMDGGSTTTHMATALGAMQVQVVTNSLLLATKLRGSWPQVEVMVTGGYYYPKSDLLLGPLAVANLGAVRANKAFISAAGVTVDGVYNSNGLVADVERAIIAGSEEVYLLADSTKLGRASLMQVCSLRELAGLVTCRGDGFETVARAAAGAGCRVLVAEPSRERGSGCSV
jgi:DeoR family transcriptional regulator, fructose operon transcriptional repressor